MTWIIRYTDWHVDLAEKVKAATKRWAIKDGEVYTLQDALDEMCPIKIPRRCRSLADWNHTSARATSQTKLWLSHRGAGVHEYCSGGFRKVPTK